jgi:Ca2+-binding RTX toxin-like protein
MAYQDYLETVQRLYIAYYQRPADPVGLVYWAKALDWAGSDKNKFYAVIDSFANSAESQALYGGKRTSDVINAIYNAAFGRNAETGGLNYWTNAINKGYTTVGRVLWEIVKPGSPLGDDAITLSNKLQTAMNFTKVIDPEHDALNLLATYAGSADAQAARNFLAQVTNNPATVKDASACKQFIQQSIADAGDPIKGEVSGQTFTFTDKIDILTGTAYDDVFIGDNSGTPLTVQMADSINGGGGNDTFKYYGYNGTMPQMKSIETLALIAATTGIDTTPYTDLKNIVVEKWKATGTRTIEYLSTQSLYFVNNNNNTNAIILQPDTGSKIAVTLDSNAQLNLNAKATAGDKTTKITELDLTAVGKNKEVTVGKTGANLATVKILGDGSIELTNKAGKIVYDASGNKGGVTVAVTVNTNSPSKFIGSSGVDTLKLGGAAAYTYQPASDQSLQNVENIVITGTKNINVLLGNQTEGFNITGNTGDNKITGGQGADTINAGAGNDIIRGGAGADTITTGAGNDIIIFDDFRTADKITDFAAANDDLYIDFQVVNTKAGNYIGLHASKVFVGMTGSFKSVRVLTASGTMIVAKQILAASANLTQLKNKVTGLTTMNPINFGTKNIPIVSLSNYAKLTAALNKLIATNSNNANALVFARTAAQGKLYFGAIIDNATMVAGLGPGGKVTIKTIATVTGSFTNADIYIM